jgi:hypothetical protein
MRLKFSSSSCRYTKLCPHYFIQQKLQSNDRLVSLGAQTLLSEEFRGQIPAEDDDDDDD